MYLATETNSLPIQSTMHLRFFFLGLLLTCSTAFAQTKNPLYGKVYRNIDQIPEMAGYTKVNGSITGTPPEGHFHEYALAVYRKDSSYVIMLEKIVGDIEQVRYQILDTLNISVDAGDTIVTSGCKENEQWNNTIVATFTSQEVGTFSPAKRAWTWDVSSEKLMLQSDVSAIKCMNFKRRPRRK